MGVPETLRLGSHGDLVVELQRFLERHATGMTIPPDVTGEFDQATHDAVEAFQAHYGIEVDGIVGPETWGVIAEVDPANWEEGSDNNPMQMEAMHIGFTAAELFGDGVTAEPDENWNARFTATGNPQLAMLAAVVDVRIAEEGLDLIDPNVAERWLKELEVVKADTRRHFIAVAERIKDDANYLHDQWEWYQNELGGTFPGRVAEGLSGNAGSDAITPGDWEFPKTLVRSARAALDDERFAEAAQDLQQAGETLADAEGRYQRLIAETRSAATFAVAALELIKDASFYIVTTIAAGEIIAAYQITGLLAKAAVSASVALAGNVTETLSEGAGHLFAGTTDEFELTKELAGDVKDSLASFVGSAAGEQFMSAFGSQFADELASKLGNYLGAHALDWIEVGLKEVLKDGSGALAESVMVNSVDGLVGQRFGSTKEFVNATVDDWMTRFGGAKAEIVADVYRLGADDAYARGDQPAVGQLLGEALRKGLLAD